MKLTDDSTPKRRYRMQARTESANETGRRILQAMTNLYMEKWLDEFSLEDVARGAGVTVQTVLRRFGSKEALLAAVGAGLEGEVSRHRGEAPVGDIEGTIQNLFDHYESVGELVLRSLAQEGMHPAIHDLIEHGRHLHYEWVERVFAPWLSGTADPAQSRLRAQLITLTDIYVWKLLYRDLGLKRQEAELALAAMIRPLLKESGVQKL